MSLIAAAPAPIQANTVHPPSAGEELLELGWEIAAQQYRIVHLAARFDGDLEWYRSGCKSASQWISARLQVQSSTAREWIRVGYELRHLPMIDEAFAAQEVSYAKVRILTRWADAHSEERLLALALERSADRLTAGIAAALAEDGETDEERDRRLHDERSFSTWTDGDGMTVIRVVLPPSVAKPVTAAVDELVRRIAETPMEADEDPSADAFGEPNVTESSPTVSTASLPTTLRELRRRWQPAEGDAWTIPSLAQQRADAFVTLFMSQAVQLTTEVVVHVRGDGTTFDDGTPTTNHAVLRQLDQAFIRLLIHDAERRPVNASSRRRHPTTRQKRVAMEGHRHECVDCQTTDLLELDHNPPYRESLRTVSHELEPRCGPCHRARHRFDKQRALRRAA
jgi:hypothetical protein